jgi:hypothetical protein
VTKDSNNTYQINNSLDPTLTVHVGKAIDVREEELKKK